MSAVSLVVARFIRPLAVVDRAYQDQAAQVDHPLAVQARHQSQQVEPQQLTRDQVAAAANKAERAVAVSCT